MRILYRIALILTIIGALNWGSIGIFGYDFVAALFGNLTTLSRVIFIAVGVAGLWCIALLFRDREWDSESDYRRHHAA